MINILTSFSSCRTGYVQAILKYILHGDASDTPIYNDPSSRLHIYYFLS